MRAYDSVDLRGAHAGGPGQHIFILRRHRDRRVDATIVLNRDGRRVYPIRARGSYAAVPRLGGACGPGRGKNSSYR